MGHGGIRWGTEKAGRELRKRGGEGKCGCGTEKVTVGGEPKGRDNNVGSNVGFRNHYLFTNFNIPQIGSIDWKC